MAVVADEVIVELQVKLDRYNANVAQAERNFSRGMDTIEKKAGNAEAFVKRSTAAMTAAFAGVSAIAVAQAFLAIAERAKVMDAQLKLATATYGSFAQAQEDSRRIAQATRSGLDETVTLYGNFIRAAKEAGKSQDEASRATETFSKALKIGGADANAAASATLQFGQALASGVLRGDEFNSIMEASPRLARLLADALGVPIGQLRKMAEEGKLTSDILFKALTDKNFTAGIDAEFRELPVTFDQAMTQIGNAATITFSAFDRGGEFSDMLANFILGGVDGFGEMATSAEEFGADVRSVLDGLQAAFVPPLEAGLDLFRQLTGASGDFKLASIEDFRQIAAFIDEIANLYNRASDEFNEGVQRATFGLYKTSMTEGYGRRSNLEGRFVTAQQASSDRLARARAMRDIDRMFGGFTPDFKPRAGTTSGNGRSPSTTTAKTKLKTPKGKTVQSLEEWLNETAIEVSNDVFKIAGGGEDGTRVIDNGSYEETMREIERIRDAQIEANAQVEQDRRQRIESQTEFLAQQFEDLFTGGTERIWDNFRQLGLRMIAQIAAQYVTALANGGGANFGSIFASAASKVFPGFGGGGSSNGIVAGEHDWTRWLPKFAGGGSGIIGGRGGTDANTLSLNGRPFANVSRGERLSIDSKAVSGRGRGAAVYQTFVLDNRGGITTTQLIEQVNQTARAEAVRAAGGSFVASQRAIPGTFGKYQQLQG